MSAAKRSNARSGSAPLSEWIVAGVSTVLVLAMLAYTTHEAFTSSGKAPVLIVRADSVVSNEWGFLVMFTVRNDGEQTAAGVTIHGAVQADTVTLEESDATLDYVPVRATRQGALLFSVDPRRHSLRLRATGFSKP